MKCILRTFVFAIATISGSAAIGHGIPIIVTVQAGALTVSNGVADPLGYAPMIFVDDSVDVMMDHLYVPALGDTFALTDLPGLNIQNMTPGSGLYLDVVPRPVTNSSPVTQRLLWHWSQQSQSVTVDPIGESLVIASDFDQITVPQSGGPQPPSLEIAAPAANEIGVHKHYLDYLLHDDPTADVGAYGFFARLTSPTYAASAPFLVILNDDVDGGAFPGQLMTAALAINAAANSSPLVGDYNGNGVVDAADYVVWRNSLGSTTALAADGSGNHLVDQADYDLWRSNFGRSASGAGSAETPSSAVPEPATVELVLPAALFAALAVFGVPKKACRV
jgi:hypothetical protein